VGNPRSGWKHKAWGASPRKGRPKICEPVKTGERRVDLRAVFKQSAFARYHGFGKFPNFNPKKRNDRNSKTPAATRRQSSTEDVCCTFKLKL